MSNSQGTMGRYRFWGDQKPDANRPLLTITRPGSAKEAAKEAVSAAGPSTGEAAAVEGTGTLRIYGPIDSWGGFWGVSAKEVAIALDLLAGAERIVVRVNSPGGESSEGRAIMNLLRACQAETVAVVDGAAYSAASYIAVGCDETVMSPGTTLMIHDTSTFIYGNADELRKQAGVLDTISDSGAELYAEVAGGTVEEWRARQKAETWYTAASAVEAGLADRVGVVPDTGQAETAGDEPEPVEGESVEDRARASYDLSLFARSPQDAANPQPPNASAVGSDKTEGGSAVAFSTEQMTNLREKLGLAETADEAAIVAAVNAVVEESLEERPETSRESAPAVKEGMSIVETATLESLRAGAAAGLEAQARLRAQDRDATIDKALRDGKIMPGRREHWVASYDADPEGTKAALEALAPGLVPTAAIGTSEQNDTTTAEDALYERVFGEQKGA